MIFDEIDRGVGGAVASAVGARSTGSRRGAIARRHPQPPGRRPRTRHLLIEKSHEGLVPEPGPEPRRDTAARGDRRMLSGAQVTDEARAQASGCWRRRERNGSGCELERLASEIARHNRLYHSDGTRRRFPTPTMTPLVRRNAELKRNSPAWCVRTSALESGRRRPRRAPFQGPPRTADAQPRKRLCADERCRISSRASAFPEPGRGEESHITAEPKIDGLSCSLRYSKVSVSRRHPRRRHYRRGRHRQCPDHQGHPAG